MAALDATAVSVAELLAACRSGGDRTRAGPLGQRRAGISARRGLGRERAHARRSSRQRRGRLFITGARRALERAR